jgi:hypothetical protein
VKMGEMTGLELVAILKDGTRLVLATDSSGSHGGIPMLRHEGCRCGSDYRPGDIAPDCIYDRMTRRYFGPLRMAKLVLALATDEAINSATLARWIGQLPGGAEALAREREARRRGG